jgi:phosphoglycolate phosphatase
VLERFERALSRPVRAADTIIVDDTPREVACALAHGCQCLAVATGRHDADGLYAAGAHHVAVDLTQVQTLFTWLPD